MSRRAIIIMALLALCLNTPVLAHIQQTGREADKMLSYIADSVISGRAPKPLYRSAVAPADRSGEVMFSRQSDLTNDMVERYLSQAVCHLDHFTYSGDQIIRSREFLRNTGAKYLHWSYGLWGSRPWEMERLADEISAVHETDWGKDIVFAAGVMEIIHRDQTDGALIPDWMYQCIEELGLDKKRKPGPNGPRYFSYEAMFDRNAKDWPSDFIGRWSRQDGIDVASVPDITMLETQLYFAYLIAEHIDAGFESIIFGQIGLAGRRERDSGWGCTYALAEFAKRYAAGRAYRNAVFLSSHHWQVDYKGKPIFTHLCWPSRLFYSDKFRHGMETGIYATEDGQHRTRFELQRMLDAPHDLPILIEIDHYGDVDPNDSYASSPEGHDEMTAWKLKPWYARAAFLRQYCLEFRTYKNSHGKTRMHLAPPGARWGYSPYKEDGGEEETIRLLFAR